MNRIVVHSRIGADGILKLTVPIGPAEADREVQVTIEAAEKKCTPSEQAQWRQFISETAGAWQGNLERSEQGDYEQRDALP
jgi:hypothetical protein